MNTSAHDFELENAAAGPDRFQLSEAATDSDTDSIVLLFQRDYHCTKCRQYLAPHVALEVRGRGVVVSCSKYAAWFVQTSSPSRISAPGPLSSLMWV